FERGVKGNRIADDAVDEDLFRVPRQIVRRRNHHLVERRSILRFPPFVRAGSLRQGKRRGARRAGEAQPGLARAHRIAVVAGALEAVQHQRAAIGHGQHLVAEIADLAVRRAGAALAGLPDRVVAALVVAHHGAVLVEKVVDVVVQREAGLAVVAPELQGNAARADGRAHVRLADHALAGIHHGISLALVLPIDVDAQYAAAGAVGLGRAGKERAAVLDDDGAGPERDPRVAL